MNRNLMCGSFWLMWCHSHKFFYVYNFFCKTQSLFLLGFSSSPGNITASNKKSTSKKVPTSLSEITIKYLYRNIIIPPLCQCGLFIQNMCQKIQLCLKMWFLSPFINVWSFFFSDSVVSYWSPHRNMFARKFVKSERFLPVFDRGFFSETVIYV